MAASSLFYVVFWMAISISMILFNKTVLDKMDFPFPMFLTTWHMALATIMTQFLSKNTNMLPGVKENKVTSQIVQKQILPVAIFFAVSLVFSNKAYIYLSVSYIQMLKACTPIAVLFFSWASGLESTTGIEVNIVTVISVGVAMTSIGESYFNWLGFFFQFFGILAESSRLVLTNIFLKELKLDPLSNLYYIAPICACFTGMACLVFEFSNLPFAMLSDPTFLLILVANGLVAFTLNIAVVMLIGNTSALTMTLAGVVKDVLLVVLSMGIFGSPVTQLQYLGYTVALLGLNLHKEYKKSVLAKPDLMKQIEDMQQVVAITGSRSSQLQLQDSPKSRAEQLREEEQHGLLSGKGSSNA